MEKYYVGKEGNRYYIRGEGIEIDGKRYVKHSNDPITIKNFLKKHGSIIIDGRIKDKNIILRTNGTEEKPSIIIEINNFKSLGYDPVFHGFWEQIDKIPFVSENIVEGKHTNIFQTMGLKLIYFNRKMIAGVLASSFILSGAPGAIINNVIEHHQQADLIIEGRASENRVLEVQSIEKQMEFDERILQTMGLQSNYSEYDQNSLLGSSVDVQKMREIFSSDVGKKIVDVAATYGVDPYLLLAKGYTETGLLHKEYCPGGIYYNGSAVGAFQLEYPDGREISAWNFETGEEDRIEMSLTNAVDFETNLKLAAMGLQKRMEFYNNNTYLVLQSYGYNQYMMDVIIHDYAEQIGVTKEDVKNNINDLGWLEIVKDVHMNPNNYYYRAIIGADEKDPEKIAEAKEKYVWRSTYGNPNYIADVLSNYVGILSQNRKMDQTSVVTNLYNNEQYALTSVEAKQTTENFTI